MSEKKLPLPGELFETEGHEAFLISPNQASCTSAWVWYAPTLSLYPGEAEEWMFERFLEAGISIAGIDVGESYGSPAGRASYSALHRYLVKERHLSDRPCLLARSRGGLMLYNWAAENARSVSGIAGIYPVCNLESYPGLAKVAPAYGLPEDRLAADLALHNPIDRLASLAEAGVPIFHIHGDADEVVPLEDNSALLADRYRSLGGTMTLEVASSQGHSMWPGFFQSSQLVSFIISTLI